VVDNQWSSPLPEVMDSVENQVLDDKEQEMVKEVVVDTHGITVPEETDAAENKVLDGEQKELVKEMTDNQLGTSFVVSTENQVVGGVEQELEKEMADSQSGTSLPEKMDSAENKVIRGLEKEAVEETADNQPDTSLPEVADSTANKVLDAEEVIQEVVKEMSDDQRGITVLEEMDAAENKVLGGEEQEVVKETEQEVIKETVEVMDATEEMSPYEQPSTTSSNIPIPMDVDQEEVQTTEPSLMTPLINGTDAVDTVNDHPETVRGGSQSVIAEEVTSDAQSKIGEPMFVAEPVNKELPSLMVPKPAVVVNDQVEPCTPKG